MKKLKITLGILGGLMTVVLLLTIVLAISQKSDASPYSPAAGEAVPESSFTGESISCAGDSTALSLVLPEGWEYHITEYTKGCNNFGISFWPKGQKGQISLYCYTGGFGVCGTGLKSEKITLAGQQASQGTYDNHSVWDFISFEDHVGCVVLNEEIQSWWDSYAEEAMAILNTIEIIDS